MSVSSGAPPVKSPVCRSMTLGMKQMKTGAPGYAAWTAATPLSASAMPTASEPAMVMGVVEPPCGMVTNPIGTPASAKTSAGLERAFVVPERGDGPQQRRDRRGAAHRLLAAGDGVRHVDRHLRLFAIDDGDRLSVLAGVGQHFVQLLQARGARPGGPGR